MPSLGPTAEPGHTQGFLPGSWASSSKIWEKSVWEQAVGQQALAEGFAKLKSKGPARGADKTTRNCLLFAWRKAANGFSKTICPPVGDFVPSLPWACLSSCLGPSRCREPDQSPSQKSLAMEAHWCHLGSFDKTSVSRSLHRPNKAGILGWDPGSRIV